MPNSPTDTTQTSKERGITVNDNTSQRIDSSVPTSPLRSLSNFFRTVFTKAVGPSLLEWALLGLVLFVAYVSFLYGDIRATFEHSFNFLDSVFSGHLRDFYTISIEHTSTTHPAVYDIPIYAIFAIWNLPTYIIYKQTGFNYLNSTPAELWLKLMLVVFTVIAAWLIYDIVRKLGNDKKQSQWAAFFFLTSISVFVPVFVVAQYDIVLIVAVLFAIRAYVSGKFKQFIAWFVLANTLKLFAIFIFIPLLILREKRISRAFLQFLVGLSGLVVCRLIYLNDSGYKTATGGFLDTMLSRLTSTGINLFSSGLELKVSFFLTILFGVTIFAFVKKAKNQNELNMFALYISFAVFLAFITLVPLNPYWIILIAPFSTLLIFASRKNLLINSLMEMGVVGSVTLIYTRIGWQMYNQAIFDQLLLPHIARRPETPRYATIDQAIASAGLDKGTSFIVAFMMACAIGLLVVNFPRQQIFESPGLSEEYPRSIALLRVFSLIVTMIPLFLMYFVPALPVVYDSSSSVSGASSNILAPNAHVTEKFSLDNNVELQKLGVGFDTSSVTWIDSSQITLSISTAEGQTLFSTTVPANSLSSGINTFDVPKLHLEASRPYVVSVTSSQTEGGTAFLQINSQVDSNETIDGGSIIDGDLVMVLSGQPLT